MEYENLYFMVMSFNITVTLIIMFAACLCCRRKIPKNEFVGLEGMVKIKNPEENNVEKLQQTTDTNSSTTEDIDLKRSSNAPHRSLPDIPVIESLNDNGSELYATVADKINDKPQGRSPVSNLKKQVSISQHSSISQADDISSPYARVKTPPHDYDKVLSTEHPYAQLNTPRQNVASISNIENIEYNQVSLHESNQSLLLSPLESQQHHQHQQQEQHQLQQQQQEQSVQQEIPAASAIAGMVSASQELPYMTPPIIQQPHFSGDSQDSSKGYTSISVREPLANILAQTNRPVQTLLITRGGGGGGNDSHYATVSDDSDEVYAAIDDPNNVYTSGSETYAQIQPTNNAITISVEINSNIPRIQEQIEQPRHYEISRPKTSSDMPIPPSVDSLRAGQIHSRQASSSSTTSSVGCLGSPKPEKRQANSPLPPTPRNPQFINSNSNLTITNSISSGRNSVTSVVECCSLPSSQSILGGNDQSKENITEINDNSIKMKNFSPSKDIEGMYAKVMKKNKFSNISSQNFSPIMRKKPCVETNDDSSNMTRVTSTLLTTEINMKEYVLNAIQTSPGKNSVKSAICIDNNYETIDKVRPRCNSYDNKDHGYETIPGDKINASLQSNNKSSNNNDRKSDGYAQIIQKEKHFDNNEEFSVRCLNFDINKPIESFIKTNNNMSSLLSEPGYESLPDKSLQIKNNQNDLDYEVLSKIATNMKITKEGLTTNNSDYDPNYEILRPSNVYSGNSDDGYARVIEKTSNSENDDIIYGYSRVKEKYNNIPGYSEISEKKFTNNDDIENYNKNHDYASILEENNLIKSPLNTIDTNLSVNNNDDDDETDSNIYSSISNEINYKSVNYFNEFHNYQSICDIKSTMKIPISVSICSTTDTNTSRTRTSTVATATTTIPSTGQNSLDNHKDYNNLKYSSASNTLCSNIQQQQSTNSNYESLTESESDPNYETVKYSDVIENPYEKLYNDTNTNPNLPTTETKIITTSSSIATTTTTSAATTTTANHKILSTTANAATISTTTNTITLLQNKTNSNNNNNNSNNINNNLSKTLVASSSNENGQVSDYFQV